VREKSRLGDAQQVVFGVVVVGGDVRGRVGDRGQPVGIIVCVAGGLAVLVGGRCASAPRFVGECGRGAGFPRSNSRV
jgi:hypothetical protein